MLVTTPNGQIVECANAYRNANTIKLLDDEGNEIYASSNDTRPYTINGGEWGPIAPAPEDKLREDVDYLLIAEMTREGLL